jgi:hypothetical protein
MVLEAFMMNWKRNFIMLVAASVLLLSTLTVSAEVDPTNDIWHWKSTEGSFSWEQFSGTNNDIDITNIDYSISGNDVTLTMTVAGSIISDSLTFYYIHLVTEDDYYMATYTNGIGVVTGLGNFSGFYSMLENPVSDNTFTATFTLGDPTDTYSIRGFSQQFESLGDELNVEWWADFAPDDYFFDYSGYEEPDEEEPDEEEPDEEEPDEEENGSTTGNGNNTPGFEIISLIVGITILIFVYRKRK